MANKTIRQRPAIFRKTNDEAPEGEETAIPQDAQTSTPQSVGTASSQGAETESQPDTKVAKPVKMKVTFHLLPEDIEAIDEIITREFRRTRDRLQRSEVVSLALQELLKRHGG